MSQCGLGIIMSNALQRNVETQFPMCVQAGRIVLGYGTHGCCCPEPHNINGGCSGKGLFVQVLFQVGF